MNAFVNMYGSFGCLKVASELFEMIELPNLVSWNSIIKILVQNGLLEKSVLYFNLMRRDGIYPDQATIVTILQGCGDVGVGKLVDAFHGNILCSGLDKSIPTVTALLNVYAKSGRLKSSSEVFNEIKEPDMIAWTAMLAAYAMHGYGRQSIKHFEFMVQKGHEPDHVTFTHLLSACSHSGLVNEGKRYFNIMSAVYKVKPKLEHYSCMVDLYGRSGLLTDARVLIDNMPMEPNSGVWGALLNGCKVYGNIELGEEVAGRLIALDPSDPRNYIMLSSIYCKAGRWADFSKVRALMKEQCLVRTAGCSFIEHDHQIHRFLVSDQAHPDSERIYAKLDQVIEKIGKAGYVPNTEFVLHDVEEEFKGDFVKKHSEKLAIAFGLLVYSDNVPIIITKNLRICGDCHNMAKFVSLVEKRVIIIRDTRRFHHFADGLCSCGDYWCGSSHGYLVILEETPEVLMINPLTRIKHSLPPLTSFPNVTKFDKYDIGREYTLRTLDGDVYSCSLKEMRDSFIKKVVFSSSPGDDGKSFVAVCILNQTGDLAYCKKGESVWRFIDGVQAYCEDVVYHKGCFYAVSKYGNIAVCDVSGDVADVSLVDTHLQAGGDMQYLVSLGDELLLVTRYLELGFDVDQDQLDVFYKTTEFCVFKLVVGGAMWESVAKLDEWALFLGENSSMAFRACDFEGCKGNSIYFTDDYSEWNYDGGNADHDLGVYDLEDGSVIALPCYSRRFYNGRRWPPPIWITPSLN
ncbi:pentatricopeptide repeat-containing protein [Tanacetum coccineum]